MRAATDLSDPNAPTKPIGLTFVHMQVELRRGATRTSCAKATTKS